MGRTTERQEFDSLLESALGGHSGRLLLVGDPGIGASTLLGWVADRARQLGIIVTVRSGRELAAADLDIWPTDVPAVLLVDDLQQADTDTLERFAHPRFGAEPGALTVAATYPHSPVIERLAGWPHLRIERLSDPDSLRLLEQACDTSIDPSVALALASACAGNPLALLEVARSLTDDQRRGRAPLPRPMPVPAHLVDAWSVLLTALPASVIAAAVDVVVSDHNGTVLQGLMSDGLWTQGDLMVLVDRELACAGTTSHPAIVSPVLEAVITSRTAPSMLHGRHWRAARLGTDLGISPAEIIHHLVQATSLPDEQVGSLIEQQAHRAEALDQLLVANLGWQQAARLSTCRATQTARALRAVQLIIENGLDYVGTQDLLELLTGERLGPEQELWVEWLQTLLRSDADPEAALAAQWATIGRARTTAPEALRELLIDAAMNAWTLGDPDAGLVAAREYVEITRTCGPDAVEPPWTGSALLAAGLFQAGEVAEAGILRARAIAEAAAVDSASMSFDRLLTTVFLDDLLLDTGAAASDRLLLAAQRAEAQSAGLACILGIRAWRYRATGRWDQAHEMLARGRPMAARLNATGPQLGMAALACELAALRGHDERLAQEGVHARAMALRTGDRRRLATVDRAFGMKALVAGRLEEAQVNLSAAADVGFLGRGLRDAVLPSRADLVEVHLRLNDAAEAQRRADAVSQILSRMDDPLARALDLRVRALVSDDLDLLRVAVEAHQESRDPFEEGRTRLLLAERLRRDRQRIQARTQLLAAERLFAMLDATPWLNRTRTELRATGAERARVPGLATLTPQEAAVAHAVASGRSNREVAAELFLSTRTVEYHLGSVYRKLGVRGRTALARALADAEAVDAVG